MKVTVYGCGYVGLVVAACFAKVGHRVVCMDVNEEKIANLKKGIIPIYEPGLDSVVFESLKAQTLEFTTDMQAAAVHGECQFIAVGTPPDPEGKADLKYVLACAQSIAQHMQNYTIIINKSTVPIGTADKVQTVIEQGLQKRAQDIPFDVVSNPEFLREGSALKDFCQPDRIVLGVKNQQAAEKLKTLYASFHDEKNKIIVMDRRSAELTKYAANAMLATKISFMNEIANLADRLGADVEQVRLGIGADQRIGYHFTHPGCGYGGSCFGKDIQALIHTAHEYDSPVDIIHAVENVNHRQKKHLFHKMSQHFQGHLQNKLFAVWGLAFKPETDDMRDAPAITLINQLAQAGCQIRVFDPQAMQEAQKHFAHLECIHYAADPLEALQGADALILLTEWPIFKFPDFTVVKARLRLPVIFDGRNVYPPDQLKALGFTYYGIGRGQSLAGLCKDKMFSSEEVPTESRTHCQEFAH